MTITKTALVFLVFVLMFSVFVANISNLISVNIEDLRHEYDMSRGVKNDKNSISQRNGDPLTISDSPEHLMWFLQISDIHISIFHDPSRVTELKEFCDLTISAVRPAVVLASGDLTDAKSEDNMGSRQYVDEWILYKDVLEECNINKKTVWLDIRGNHDNFNVPSLQSKVNYYRNYSVQGRIHPKSYLYELSQGGETYSFIGMDACLEPGPRRPFNFVGMLSSSEWEHVERLSAASRGNYTVWFGHYPTSCILTTGPGGVRALISHRSESLVYLCGHYHMLGGAVPNMYTLQQTGFLELELGDWKDNRVYRLAALDHGLFSFIDIIHRDWPVVLVTNPKHALYQIPNREPLGKILHSTHVRVLAFSLSPISRVEVRIGEGGWSSCHQVEGPLYVLSWDPNEYCSGLHYIHVRVEDEAGREKTATQPFSLDNTRLNFRIFPRIVLMSNISTVFQCLFGAMLLVNVVPLCILKYLHKLVREQRIQRMQVGFRCLRRWLRKLWVLATVNCIFYPLVCYALYLTIGPWSVGEVIEGYTGVIFAWGTIINGSYLPGSFTYAYGFLQMCTFQLPLTLLLAHSVEQRLVSQMQLKRISGLGQACIHLTFIILILVQLMFAYFFWLAYGTMAFLVGPLRTWSVALALALWYRASTLPETSLREAARVWCSTPEPIILEDQEPRPEVATIPSS